MITIAPHYTRRECYWTELREVVRSKNLILQYADEGGVYTIWGYNGPEAFVCTVWKDVVPESVVASGYTQELNDADKTEFESVYKSSCNSSLESPRELDRKPVVVISPATEGWMTWITGRADKFPPDPGTTGRGLGNPMWVAFSSSDPANTIKEALIQFLEPVEIHDGQVSWAPVASFSHEDYFSFKVYIPATSETPNGSNTGNCNLIPLGPPDWNVIIPAAGDGAYDVDLATAVPVPDSTKSAFWDVAYATGAVSPSPSPGTASYNLFTFDVETALLKRIPLGNPMGVFDVDVYKTEYFHPTWTLKLAVTKATPADGKVGGWLFTFRRYTT